MNSKQRLWRWNGRGRAVLSSLCLAAALGAQEVADVRAPGSGPALSVPRDLPRDAAHALPPRNWIDQTPAEADLNSRGCLECHAGSEPMHSSKNVVLGCIDCHGGNATPGLTQAKAHVAPRHPIFWQSSTAASYSGWWVTAAQRSS